MFSDNMTSHFGLYLTIGVCPCSIKMGKSHTFPLYEFSATTVQYIWINTHTLISAAPECWWAKKGGKKNVDVVKVANSSECRSLFFSPSFSFHRASNISAFSLNSTVCAKYSNSISEQIGWPFCLRVSLSFSELLAVLDRSASSFGVIELSSFGGISACPLPFGSKQFVTNLFMRAFRYMKPASFSCSIWWWT